MEPIHTKGWTAFFLSLYKRKPTLLGRATIAVFVVCGLVSPVFHVQSQDLSGPNTAFRDALWIAESEKLEKIATEDSRTVLQIPSSYRQIAIDSTRAVVWGYGTGRIDRLDFSGGLLSTHQVDAEETDRATVALAVNDNDGSVWLGVGKRLYHIDAYGQSYSSQEFGHNIVGAGVDSDNSLLWLATEKQLIALEDSGSARFSMDFESQDKLRALTNDPQRHLVWVATDDGIQSFDASGRSIKRYPLAGVNHLAATERGDLWAANDKQLSRIESTTEMVAYQVFPFGGQGTIDALTADARHDQVWVAQNKKILRFSASGEFVDQWQALNPVRDLASYADVVSPTLEFVSPAAGSYLNDNRPAFELEARDLGIGVDLDTFAFSLDGEPVPSSCQLSQELAICTLDDEIPEGNVEVSATVADYSGNASQPAIVNFTVDTIAPEITVSSPVDGTLTREPALTVLGSLSESARVSVNGQYASVDVQNTFQYGPLNLIEGVNTLELIAEDLAGNTSTTFVSVTLDTTPPAVFPPPDIYVEATGPLTPVVLGTASATDILSGNLVPTPSHNGPFAVGIHTVVWQAVDEAGNIGAASQTVAVVDTTPPVVIAPAEQTIEATAIETPVDLGTASAFDLVDGALSPVPDPPGPFALGEHTVIWTATDAAGNAASATQPIHIVDTTAPTLAVPPDITLESSSAPIPIDIGAAEATDLFGPITVSNDAPDVFAAGETVVTWTAEDANGNKRVATQNVILVVQQVANSWSQPELLEHKEEPAFLPMVKTDSAGRAVAVWRQRTYDNGPWDAYASRFVGDQWTTPVLIEQLAGNVFFLDLALGPDGSASVIGSAGGIAWTARFEPDSGWQPEIELGQTDWGASVTYDKIVVDRSGNITVAWLHYGEVYSNVQAVRYTRYEGWGQPQVLGAQADWVYYHSIDVTLFDDVLISWAQGVSGEVYSESAWMVRHAADSGWQDAIQLDSGDAIWSPHFAVNSKGDAVAAWIKRQGGSVDVWTSLYSAGSGWSTPELLTNTPGGREGEPRVAMDAAGNSVAVWLADPTGSNGDTYRLFGASRSVDHDWGTPQQISTGTTARIYDTPSLSVNASGQGFVVWPQLKDEFYWHGHDIWVSRLAAEGADQAPVVYPPPDLIVEATAAPLSPVDLGEARAFDFEGRPLNATPSPNSPLGLGVHSITWTATDSAGRSASAIQTVVVRDTTPPTLIPPADIDKDSADGLELGESFTADIFGVAMVENDAPDQFPQGLTVVTWTATDNNGNQTTATQRVAIDIPFTLTIDSPIDGAHIDGDTVIVQGTIVGPINTAVTVNGIPAEVFGSPYGTEFVAHISVEQGANTINVVGITPDGYSTQRSLALTATGVSPIKIDVTQVSSLPPSSVVVSFSNNADPEILLIEVDINADGIYDFQLDDPNVDLSYTFEEAGIYRIVIKTTFTNGDEQIDSRLVVVHDGVKMDNVFRSIWSDLNRALVNQDIDLTKRYLTYTAQKKYLPVFNVLAPHMEEIISSYSTLRRASIFNGIGEYAITRVSDHGKHIFLVYFIRGENGAWQISDM